MARRQKIRTVYRRAKTAYRRASSGNSFKPIVNGVLAGAGGKLATKYVGSWGRPLAYVGIGYFMKDNTLKTLGGIGIGETIGSMVTGNGGNGGGFFE
jgi:hypothetical protein